jgi:hypothetical protein
MSDGERRTNLIADCGLRMADGRFGEKGERMTQLSNSKDGLEFAVERLSIALAYYHCTYHASPENCHSPVELPVPGSARGADGPSASTPSVRRETRGRRWPGSLSLKSAGETVEPFSFPSSCGSGSPSAYIRLQGNVGRDAHSPGVENPQLVRCFSLRHVQALFFATGYESIFVAGLLGGCYLR